MVKETAAQATTTAHILTSTLYKVGLKREKKCKFFLAPVRNGWTKENVQINLFFWLFVYSYVLYATLHCAQSSKWALRLCSKLSGFDWGTQLTCGCRHSPQTGALTSVKPAAQAARGACYSSLMPWRNKVQMLYHALAPDALGMLPVRLFLFQRSNKKHPAVMSHHLLFQTGALVWVYSAVFNSYFQWSKVIW